MANTVGCGGYSSETSSNDGDSLLGEAIGGRFSWRRNRGEHPIDEALNDHITPSEGLYKRMFEEGDQGRLGLFAVDHGVFGGSGHATRSILLMIDEERFERLD